MGLCQIGWSPALRSCLVRSLAWSQRLLSLLLLGIVIAIPIAWIVGAYMRVELTELIGYRVADGFCAVGSEPFGRHCFSDFSVITQLLDAPSFWDPSSGTATAYPPSGWAVPVGIYLGAGLIGGVQFATYAFLIVALVSVLTPAIWVSQGDWWRRAPLAFLVLGAGAAPVLVVLDRGNSTALIVLPLMIFALGLYRNSPTMVIGGVTASALLKPQMILLVIALLALGRYRQAAASMLLSFLGLAISFVAWPGNRLRNVKDWFGNVSGYSDYGTLDVLYPYNLSAARSLLVLLDATGLSWLIGEEYRGHVVNVLTNYAALPGAILLVASLLVVFLRKGRMDILSALFLSVSLIIVVPGTSFSYYLVLLVPVAALVLKDPRGAPTALVGGGPWKGVLDALPVRASRGFALRAWIVVVVLVLCFSLWTLPLPPSNPLGDLMGNSVGLIQTLWGPVLLLATIAMLMSLCLSPSASEGEPLEAALDS